jgi:hypothetical protein
MQIQLKGLINPSLPTPLGETGGAQLGPLAPNSSASPLSLARGLCTNMHTIEPIVGSFNEENVALATG